MSLLGRHESSNRSGAALTCVLILGVFLLVIVNWRSAIAVRFSSGNLDLVVFSLGITVLPLVLLWSAARLPDIYSAIFSVVALCMLGFSAAVWFWNFHTLGRIARGLEVQPLLASVPFGNERIAAYEVETSPAGAYIALRLQFRLIPGLLISREFAVINSPVIDRLTVSRHAELCVTFPSVESGANSKPNELRTVLPIEPLFHRLTAPIVIEPIEASARCVSR